MPILPWTEQHQKPEAQIYPPKAYQTAWLLAFEDPYIEKIVLEKSARVGYAIFINTVTGWIITNDPGDILICENTETDAGKFAEGEIGKVFKYSPVVAERLLKGSKKTATEKSFYGGRLLVGHATSGGTFRMVTIRYFFADEVSGWPASTEKEGCGIRLGIVRTESEDRRKIVIGSTPKITGSCKVTKEFKDTDQRYAYIPCPNCQHEQRLKIANLRYTPGYYKDAHFVCESCTREIKESDKYEFMKSVKWRATRDFTCCGVKQKPHTWDEKGTALCSECHKPGDTNERGMVEAGFHIWTAYNDNANTSFPAIAKEYQLAKDDPEKEMQRFRNTVVGKAHAQGLTEYQLQGFEKLYKRREEYDPPSCLPPEIKAVFFSADTQKDRFEYQAWGIGEKSEVWALDYGVVQGDPEEISTQNRLIKVFNTEYLLTDGRRIGAFACVLDCNGSYWQSMLTFCRDYEGWLYAIRGQAQKKDKASHDLTLSKNTHPEAQCEYRSLNVHKLKNRAAEFINNLKPGPRYVHFPNNEVFDLTYFKMLTAEELTGIGLDASWDKKKGFKRNEPWDLLVYFLWLMHFFKSDIDTATVKDPLGLIAKKDDYGDQAEQYQHTQDFYEVEDVY